jgi:hypothetical protein
MCIKFPAELLRIVGRAWKSQKLNWGKTPEKETMSFRIKAFILSHED